MKWRRLVAGLSIGLACVILSGCAGIFGQRDRGKESTGSGAEDLSYGQTNLLRSKILADFNRSVGGRLVSARYTAPYYRYALDFPGLLRVDNQGYLTCGHISGNLHQVSLDTIFGPVKLMHPQEGQTYQAADKNSDNGEEADEQEGTQSSGADPSGAEDSARRQMAATAVTFHRKDFTDGEALLKAFFVKSGLALEAAGEASSHFAAPPLVDSKEMIGDQEWYHLAYGLSGSSQEEDRPGAEIHFYAAVIEGIPFIVSHRTESLTERYQSFEYTPLQGEGEKIQAKVPDLLKEILGSIEFYKEPGQVLQLFDAGCLMTDPRGGSPVDQVVLQDQAAVSGAYGKAKKPRQGAGHSKNAQMSPVFGLHYNDARLPGQSYGLYTEKSKQLSDRVTKGNEKLAKQELLVDLLDFLTSSRAKIAEKAAASAGESESLSNPESESADETQRLEPHVAWVNYLAEAKPAPLLSTSWEHPAFNQMQAEIYQIPAAVLSDAAAGESASTESVPAESDEAADSTEQAAVLRDAYLLCFRTERYIGFILDRGEPDSSAEAVDCSLPDVRLNGLLVSAASLIKPEEDGTARTWGAEDLLQGETGQK